VCWRDGNDYRLYHARWDNEAKTFMNSDFRWISFSKGDIFYSYVGYIPYIEKECHPIKCGYFDENGEECACPYGFDDNGYCMNYEFKCEHMKVVTEYSLGSKPIWKEFE
jgi:hypothetical protein